MTLELRKEYQRFELVYINEEKVIKDGVIQPRTLEVVLYRMKDYNDMDKLYNNLQGLQTALVEAMDELSQNKNLQEPISTDLNKWARCVNNTIRMERGEG